MQSEDMAFQRYIDMRHVGQSYELSVDVPHEELTTAAITRLVEQFHAEHARAYGFNAPHEPTEFVNMRLTAQGKITKPKLHRLEAAPPDNLASALQKHRPVYFTESGGFVDCPIYLRYELGSGARIEGPALVVEMDSMTVLHPGFLAVVDGYGNLLITPVCRMLV
jgi:N-methylhydantoinase A